MKASQSVWQNCLVILTFCALSTAAQNTVPPPAQPDLPPACRQPDQRDKCIEELVDAMLARRKERINAILAQKNTRTIATKNYQFAASQSCTCPDGRTFAAGDTIIFNHVPLFSATERLTTGRLTRVNSCGLAEFKYVEYLPSISGKIHKLNRTEIADRVCGFSKPEPRRSIVEALAADPSLLKDAPSYEIPEESKDSSDQESKQRRPPESGNLLEGMKTGEQAQLPGGFKAGDYVFVPKDAHIKGQKIPRETMGIVLGSAGKNNDKLRVKFLVHKTGRAILDFVVGIYIPWTPMNPYQEVIVPIDPADVWGINMPRIF